MRLGKLYPLILLCLFVSVFLAPPCRAVEPTTASNSKFRGAVEKFAEQPEPASGGILLVGSSTFTLWKNAAQDLAPLPVTNRAFGGSQTSHQLLFFDQVIPSARPALLVWYCGSNDINAKKTVGSILERTSEWIARVQKSLPTAQILILSAMRSPQKKRDGYLLKVDELNEQLSSLPAKTPRVFYLDLNPAFQDGDGEPCQDLYVEDGLHLNPSGYQRMVKILRPAIQQHWSPAKT